MDFDALKRELETNGAVKAAVSSAEAKKLMRGINSAELEKAAKSGDTTALKSILSQVLSTPEGRSLAEQVQKAVRKDG